MCVCVCVRCQECLEANSKTMYDLLSSHGAVDDMVFFAMLMKGHCFLFLSVSNSHRALVEEFAV